MYEIFLRLMEEKKLTPYKVSKDTGITQATFSRWKTGKASPSIETLQILSDYFHVSTDYLLGKEDNKKTPALTEKDRRDIARDLERMRADLENSDTLMFEGNPMSPEARESILAAVKLGLEAAKIQNKQKYTPKKYKKG